MPPFEQLGVDHSSDPAQIKRAYARLLKQHRPDEDPEGFQRLHEAYVHCLAMAQMRSPAFRRPHVEPPVSPTPPQTDQSDAGSPAAISPRDSAFRPLVDSDSETTPPLANGTPHHPPGILLPAHAMVDVELSPVRSQEPTFHPDHFLDELTQRANETTSDGLVAWLHAHPSLYSLDAKDALAARLVHHLIERPALQPEHLRALLRFFDLDTINPRTERLQRQIERLYRRSAEASGDWSDVAYMYERPQSSSKSDSKSGGSWWPWGLMLFFLFRILAAILH